MKFRGREELDVAELKVAFKADHRQLFPSEDVTQRLFLLPKVPFHTCKGMLKYFEGF